MEILIRWEENRGRVFQVEVHDLAKHLRKSYIRMLEGACGLPNSDINGFAFQRAPVFSSSWHVRQIIA